jgi:hypothetical protein
VRLFGRDREQAVDGYRHSPALIIRWASAADAARVDLLAQLDDASVPHPPVLLGFVGDELWVALSLDTGALISNPFRASAEVAGLVLERGRQLIVPSSCPSWFGLRLRRRTPRGSAFTRALGHEMG